MNRKASVLVVILLMIASFLAGSAVAKKKYGEPAFVKTSAGRQGEKGTPAQALVPTQLPFSPKKSSKPEVKFFVMSFCPYGNQAEAGLEPVYQLLKDKVTWSPQYIVSDKKSSCEQSCPYRVYNDQTKTRCEEAIKQGQVKDLDTCKTYFPYQSTDECLKKDCAGLKAGEFESLHGPQEFNQDIREIIAYSLAVEEGAKVLGAKSSEGILSKWWKFVTLVNSKCSANNADTCWREQAIATGIDASKISQTEKTQAVILANKEIEQARKYNASGSPTVYINEVLYNGGRAPEDYKKAICSSFESPPEECSTVLGAESAGASGGCN